MKKIALYLIFCIPVFGFSQSDSSNLKEYKHEIGTNLAPLLVELMNPHGYQPEGNFTLMYKYHFTHKWGLRFIPSNQIIDRSIYIPYNFNLHQSRNYTNLLYEIDSVKQVYEQYSYWNQNRFQLNLGLERKKKLSTNTSLFYGLDLFYAHQKSRDIYLLDTQEWDSTENRYLPSFNHEEIYSTTWRSHYIGLSPFFGLKHNFGKHFTLSGNFNINFSKRFIKRIRTEYYGNDSHDNVSNFSTNEAWSNGLISDLSVSYRF